MRLGSLLLLALAAFAQPHQFQLVRQFGPANGAASDLPAVTASRGSVHLVGGRTFGALPGETNAGASDVFVRAYDDSGNLLWSRQFGTVGDDFVTGLAIDASGNIIVAGSVCGALPGQPLAGDCDAYLRKYDPAGALSWTRQFGTVNRELGGKVAVDAAGNIAFAGSTRGSFPSFTLAGFSDAFITRYDAAGNQLWLKQFGTAGFDEGNGIAIDANGFIVACGGVEGSLNGQPALGAGDGFLMKLDSAGVPQWTAQFGGSGSERCVDLAISPAGPIFAVLNGALRHLRQFTSAGVPVNTIGFGAEITGVAADATGFSIVGVTQFALSGQTSTGGNDAYIRRYNNASVEQWTDLFGTVESDSAAAVSTNGSSLFLAGLTGGVLPGESPGGLGDVFVRKYSLAGVEAWTDQFGGSGPASSYGSAVHVTATRIFTAGQTDGAMPASTNFGNADAVLTAHDLIGNLLWVRQFGTDSTDNATAVGADAAGNVYVAGTTGGVLPGATRTSSLDGFLKKFDAAGNELWTRQFGSAASAFLQISGLVVDPAGDVYLTGNTTLPFPGQINAGNADAFVRKVSAAGTEIWTRQFGPASADYGFGIALDTTAGIVVAGQTNGGTFPGQVKFGNGDGFVARLDAGGNVTWVSQIGIGAGQLASLGKVTVAPDGSIYAAGYNSGVYPGQLPAGGFFDLSLAKLSSAGSLLWARQFGGTGDDRSVGVAVDAASNISVIGSLGSTNVSDTAIFRYSPSGTLLGSFVHVTPNTDLTFAGAANANGLIVATGYTQSAFLGQTQSGKADVFIKQFGPPNNVPAISATAATVAANEGTIAANTGAFADLDGDTVTLSASSGTVLKTGPANWSWTGPAVEGPSAQFVTITANDGRGGITTVTFQVAIANLPPVLGSATGPSAPVAKGASVTIAAPVADPGVLDPITCRFQWADGTADTVKPAATGACSAAHTYAIAGVYTVTITASDDDGASVSTTFASVVVSDPNAGFLTGGGWIQGPTGRANFSFEIKNEGNESDDDDDDDSELDFQSGNLRFRGTSHEWLIIAGARAQAKGAGKLNGVSGYTYLLSVVDGKITGPGAVDKFRIKIWKNATATTPQTLIYDNVPTAPDTFDAANPQPLGGGNITIHPKESKDKHE